MVNMGIIFNGIKENAVSDTKGYLGIWILLFKATTEGAAEIKSPTPPINPIKIELGASHG